MSNNTLVARALAELSESRVLIRSKIIDEPIATLIRAVDEQYPAGYDEAEGCMELPTISAGPFRCAECRGRGKAGHSHDCDHWNTRVALLALCRDILGEKG